MKTQGSFLDGNKSRDFWDIGGFVGQWPFHLIRQYRLEDLLENHRGCGIRGGLVSSLPSVFYDDPWEGDRIVNEKLTEAVQRGAGGDYRLALSINPCLLDPEISLQRGMRLDMSAAVRLYPGIHAYPLMDERVLKTVRLAGRMGLAVIITARLEDVRMEYLLRQRPVKTADCLELACACPGVQIVMSGFYLSELMQIHGRRLPHNLWADLAGMCHGVFALEQLTECFPTERLLYGSFFPLYCIQSTWLTLWEKGVTDTDREQIGKRNYLRLLACVSENRDRV